MKSQPFGQSTPGTASEWFAARRRPHDPDLEAHFSRWISEDPRNADEYALCELTWELSETAAAGLDPATHARPWYRRRSAAGFAAAASVAFAVVAAAWFWPPATSSWSTAPGEQRAIALDDGSRIMLNTRSVLEVRLSRSLREVRLLGGEAFFEVATDAKRPFVVATALGTARALGTRFNVLLDPQHVEVATEEGAVMVSTLDAQMPGVLTRAGARATIVRGGSRPQLDRADLSRIENWRAHRLEFDRVPLDAALREFSRYSAIPVRAATPEIARLPVSAVLNVGDVAALRVTLRGAFGLALVSGRNEWLVVEPNRSP